MAGFKDLFIPREMEFFQHLKTQVDLLHDAAMQLSLLSKHYTSQELESQHASLVQMVVKGDALALLVTQELHETFITPIDREEIQDLSFNLNRVLHSVEKIVSSIQTYNLPQLDTALVTQVQLLQDIVSHLVSIFQSPLSIKQNQETIAQIKAVEDKADNIYREALSELFSKTTDPIEIIKKKDILKIVEKAIDKAEFVANIMQNVLINHA
jgi:uncharacterized protein Yka (UPF0111/DUF47 family)